MRKKIICITIISCFLLLIGCGYHKEPKYVHLSDNIINKTAKELKNEKRLNLIGRGGSMMYDVKKLGISFDSVEDIDIKEGRKLILYCIQIFLSNINSDEQIRQYLHTYPFQIKDIDVHIYFKEKKPIGKQTIDTVSMYFEKIIYSISDKEEILKKVHEETYEEALKIVEGEKSSN